MIRRLCVAMFIQGCLAGCAAETTTVHIENISAATSNSQSVIDRPYLVAMPEFWRPWAISEDGNVIIGDPVFGGSQIWTKGAGLLALPAGPPGYWLGAKALNYDGSIIVGQFNDDNHDYGMFRWTSARGVELLNPHVPVWTFPIGLPIQVSGDGAEISFSSEDYYVRDAIEKVWIEGKGFESLSDKFKNHFDYIRPASDFKTYLVATFNPPTFGRIDANGNYVAFTHFTRPFDQFIDTDPDKDRIIMNSDASLVAEQRTDAEGPPQIWNAEGRLLPPLKLLPGCKGYAIAAIDDLGGIFVNANCPELAQQYYGYVGLRVTSGGVQTIAEWLSSEGLPNNLPSYVSVKMVSANGKTFFGVTAGPPQIAVVGMGSSQTSPDKTPPVSTDTIGLNTEFVAHLP